MASQQAVGALETKGFPGVLAAADAMVKAGRVTLVGYLRCGSARFCVMIRGDVSEVKMAMDAGVVASEKCPGILGNYSPPP
jgi:microcompartment protein CcmL/EutN